MRLNPRLVGQVFRLEMMSGTDMYSYVLIPD